MSNANDTLLFSQTPSGLTDEALVRRYRAADAVAKALGEPIETFLSDWAPSHISNFRQKAANL